MLTNLLASAQVDWWKLEGIAAPKFQDKNIGFVISQLLPYVFIVAGLVMLFYLIYSGFQYMVSAGDVKAMEVAKKNITYAVVGFIVIFSAWWAVQLMGYVLDIQKIRIMFQ